MRLQENGEVWVSWFVGYFIRIISSVGYHPKYSERWGVVELLVFCYKKRKKSSKPSGGLRSVTPTTDDDDRRKIFALMQQSQFQ